MGLVFVFRVDDEVLWNANVMLSLLDYAIDFIVCRCCVWKGILFVNSFVDALTT